MTDNNTYTIRNEKDGETIRIRNRLAAVGMLCEDIDPDRSQFWVAERTETDTESLVGTVRLELDTPNALLGSLYVAPEHRGNGLGSRLIECIEQEARSRGATSLYLFSTGAGAYFRARGYEEVPVEETITAVSNTPQVEYYRNRPELLTEEVTFRTSLNTESHSLTV